MTTYSIIGIKGDKVETIATNVTLDTINEVLRILKGYEDNLEKVRKINKEIASLMERTEPFDCVYAEKCGFIVYKIRGERIG